MHFIHAGRFDGGHAGVMSLFFYLRVYFWSDAAFCVQLCYKWVEAGAGVEAAAGAGTGDMAGTEIETGEVMGVEVAVATVNLQHVLLFC